MDRDMIQFCRSGKEMMRKLFLLIIIFAAASLSADILIDNGEKDELLRINNQATLQQLTLPDGLVVRKVTCRKKSNAEVKISYPREVWLPNIEKTELFLGVYLPSASAVSGISLVLRDYENKTLAFNGVIPKIEKSGWYSVRFDIDAQKSGADGRFLLDFPVAVYQITISFSPTAGTEFWLYLGKLELKPLDVAAWVDTGSAVSVLDLYKKQNADIKIENYNKSAVNLEVDYKLTDIDGQVVDSGRKTVEIPGGDVAVIPMKETPGQGIYNVEYRVLQESAPSGKRTWKCRYAAMFPAGPTPEMFPSGFIFSVHSHPLWYRLPERKKMIELLALCGAKHTRTGGIWPTVQPQKDEWNFAPLDDLVARLAEKNIELQPILAPAPNWASAKDWKPVREKGLPRPDYKAYGEFIRKTVEHYHGKIRMYEAWNEPDIPFFANFTPDEYVQLQRIAWSEVKKADPNALLLTAGFAHGDGGKYQRYVFQHAPDSFDIHAVHGHSYFNSYISIIEQLHALRKDTGVTQPWFANETSVSSPDEKKLAVTLFKKLIYSWANGSIGYTWYNLRNKGFDQGHTENVFGFVSHDFYPKLPYLTFNMLAGVYRHATFVKEEKFLPEIYAFRFEDQDHTLISVWTESLECDRQLLNFAGNAEKIEMIDINGNITELPINNGQVAVAIASTPGTIRLSPASSTFKYVNQLLRSRNKVAIRAGGDAALDFEVNNADKVSGRYTVKITPPAAVSSTPASRTETIFGGKSGAFRFKLTATSDFSSTYDDAKQLSVELLHDGKPMLQPVSFALQPEITIQRNLDKFQQIAIIRNPEQVKSLVAPEPSNSHLFWTGRNDCSAYISAKCAGNQLQILVGVFDDHHSQPFRGHDMYRGDNIQHLLAFPGQKGMWEIGISRLDNGETASYIWSAPPGFNTEEILKKMRVNTNWDDRKVLFYSIFLPLKEMGTSLEELKKGFRYNLIVNDNDGSVRESYLSIITGNPKIVENLPIVNIE